MPQKIVEGRLEFSFPNDWEAVKYDDKHGFAVRTGLFIAADLR